MYTRLGNGHVATYPAVYAKGTYVCRSGFVQLSLHFIGMILFNDLLIILFISLPTLRSTLMVLLPVNLERFSSGVTTSYISVVLKRKRRMGK